MTHGTATGYAKRACETCGKSKDDGRRECATCRVRRYRQDPEKRERDRERSRRWKRSHRGPVTSDVADKTPGNQIGPASGATDRDRGNQERGS